MDVGAKFYTKEILKKVSQATKKTEKKGADLVYNAAKSSREFKNKDNNLRNSIYKLKSKYKDGGYIVLSNAPHAHLIEYGCRGGQDGSVTDAPPIGAFTKKTHAFRGQQAPRPFMRNALKKYKNRIKKQFGEDIKDVLK